MFTGLVHHRGRIDEVSPRNQGVTVRIYTEFDSLTLGESIAVDGVCLTVMEVGSGWFRVEISPETLNCSLAKQYRAESAVNLERALRVGDALGGHWVTGHVDTTAVVSARENRGDYVFMRFSMFLDFSGLIIDKGSVTVSGVSLTVNEVLDDGFSIMLVPHTLKATTLVDLKPGNLVNIEFDCLGKMVRAHVESWKGKMR